MRKKHDPQRSCVVCSTKVSKRDLIRVVMTPEGDCDVDDTGKRAGRGAYLCHQARCWHAASKGDRLARALRSEITATDRGRLAAFGEALDASASPVA
jgi:hypothetical protein